MLRFALFLLSLVSSGLMFSGAAKAQEYQSFIDNPVRVCEADPGSNEPPNFSRADCWSTLFYQSDPQNRMVWVELTFEVEPTLLGGGEPLGLFLSAKASSLATLNGIEIGSNGTPGRSQMGEIPGDMDAVFFVPDGVLQEGENSLTLRMSSMNGGITLESPIHNIVLAPYRDPRQPGPATWFALATFGLFVAAFVFFGVRSLRGDDRKGSALIAAISLTAGLQLAAEAARDIIPYPYPLHDLRLTLILTFAIGLGLSIAAYVFLILFRAYPRRRLVALGVLLATMILISALKPGFDVKTGFVLISSCLAAGIAGLIAYFRGNRDGAWFALAGFTIAATILWLGGMFLDTVLYLIVAICVLWLFFKQARSRAVQTTPVAETAAEPEAVKRIELSNHGKVEFVEATEILRFSGAGDYVEVFLDSGRSALHSASLAALERELSDGFIRVHRSHIVNASKVKSLTRESAGTGELQMSDGSMVPVSRRNMAGVKAALKQS